MLTKKEIFLIAVLFLINIALVLIFKMECPWKSMFDIDCAGCGSTRMFYAILELDFYQAFRFNPFIFISLCLLIIYIVYVVICKLIHKKYFILGRKVFITYVILLIVFMILRNISIFSFLKPTIVH